jgi:hypothetical protein
VTLKQFSVNCKIKSQELYDEQVTNIQYFEGAEAHHCQPQRVSAKGAKTHHCQPQSVGAESAETMK